MSNGTGLTLVLDWDRSLLRPLEERGLEKALTNAMMKAGGDAIRAMRAESNRSIRARKRIKASYVTRGLALRFPRSTKSIGDLEWKIVVSNDPVPMAAYQHRQVKSGVSVAINRGKRSIVRHAFMVTLKSGHRGVYVREESAKTSDGRDSKRRVRKNRLPLKELFSSRIADVFRDNGMVPAVFSRGNAVFGSSLSRLLPLEVEKLRKAG